MKERPILFSSEMVRAILEGRKTQTRRIVKFTKKIPSDMMEDQAKFHCPHGQVGDRLWVRETFFIENKAGLYYCDPIHENTGIKWSSPLFMPRWASRITLEITNIRVERLQEIGDRNDGEDIAKEGLLLQTKYDFKKLWNSINSKRGYSWESNPWVWVIEFKRI